MYDEDDVREVRGLPHGQERWGEPVRNGDGDAYREGVATSAALMEDVSAGLRVLVTRDGLPLTEAAIRERAANIVSGLVGNYRITRLDGVTFSRPVDFNDARIR